MMDREPPGTYADEPEERFNELPAELVAPLYHAETVHLTDSIRYGELLRERGCRTILECGCGTGRIAEHLASRGFLVTGIDILRPMLTFNQPARHAPVAEMDMRRLGFHSCFDAVIIAHNTLNLLGEPQAISDSLREIAAVLQPGGHLLLHLYVPDQTLTDAPGQRFFQFLLLDLPGGGKLVKEALRSYHPEQQLIVLEERYKLRLLPDNLPNRNYRQTHRLAALPVPTWRRLLEGAGFLIDQIASDLGGRPFQAGTDASLVIIARRPTPPIRQSIESPTKHHNQV